MPTATRSTALVTQSLQGQPVLDFEIGEVAAAAAQPAAQQPAQPPVQAFAVALQQPGFALVQQQAMAAPAPTVARSLLMTPFFGEVDGAPSLFPTEVNMQANAAYMTAELAKVEAEKKAKSLLMDARAAASQALIKEVRALTKKTAGDGASLLLPRVLRAYQLLATAVPSNAKPFIVGELGKYYEEHMDLVDPAQGVFDMTALDLALTEGAHSTVWETQRLALELIRLTFDEDSFRELISNVEFAPLIGSCGGSAFVLLSLLWAAEVDAAAEGINSNPELYLTHRSDMRAGKPLTGGTMRAVRAKVGSWIHFYIALSFFVPRKHDKMVLSVVQLYTGLFCGKLSALTPFASSAVKRDIMLYLENKGAIPHDNKMTLRMYFEQVQIQLGEAAGSIPPIENPGLMVNTVERRARGRSPAGPPPGDPPQRRSAAGDPPQRRSAAAPSTQPRVSFQSSRKAVNDTFPPEAGEGETSYCWEDWAKIGSCELGRSCRFRHTNIDGSTVDYNEREPGSFLQALADKRNRNRGRGGRGRPDGPRGRGRGRGTYGRGGGHASGGYGGGYAAQTHGRGHRGGRGRGRGGYNVHDVEADADVTGYEYSEQYPEQHPDLEDHGYCKDTLPSIPETPERADVTPEWAEITPEWAESTPEWAETTPERAEMIPDRDFQGALDSPRGQAHPAPYVYRHTDRYSVPGLPMLQELWPSLWGTPQSAPLWQTLTSMTSNDEDSREMQHGPINQDARIDTSTLAQDMEGIRLSLNINKNHYNITENTNTKTPTTFLVLPRVVVMEVDIQSGRCQVEQVMLHVDPQRLVPDHKGIVPRIIVTDPELKTQHLLRPLSDKALGPRTHECRSPRVFETDVDTKVIRGIISEPAAHCAKRSSFLWDPPTPVISVHSTTGVVERRRDARKILSNTVLQGKHHAHSGQQYLSKKSKPGALVGLNIMRYLRTEPDQALRAIDVMDLPASVIRKATRQGAGRLPKLSKSLFKQIHDTLLDMYSDEPVLTTNGEQVQYSKEDKYSETPNMSPTSGPEVHGLSEGEIEESRADNETLSKDERTAKKTKTGDSRSMRWMADSGANCHVSRDRDSFITYKQYSSPRVITGATSGTEVHAYGVGTVCIKLAAEKIQPVRLNGSRRNKPQKSDQYIYIMLQGVIYAPSMSRNYLNTTALRKTEGGVINIVGDIVSNRVIAGTMGLQYTMEEADGQEFIAGSTLSAEAYHSLEGVEVHAVQASVHTYDFFGTPKEDESRSRKQRKRLNRAIGKMSADELERIVFAPESDTKYDTYMRESARIQLSKAGHYTYHDGAHDLILEWHHKFGHASIPTTIRKMREIGLAPKMTRAQKVFCEWCMKNRPRKQPVSSSNRSPTKDVLWGKFFVDVSSDHTAAIGTGNKHCTAFIERHSGLAFSYYHKDLKNMDRIVAQFVAEVKPLMEASGQTKANFSLSKNCVHSDNAAYFVGKSSPFSKALATHGINQVSGAAYTPQHQGMIERWFQTISKRGKALRASAGLEGEFWEASWRYAAKTYNWLDNGNTVHNQSPMQVATGKNMREEALALKPFGAKCFVSAPQKGVLKDDVSAYDAIYLGPTSTLGNVWIADQRPGHRGVRIQKHVTIVDEVPRKMADDNIVDIGTPFDNEVWLQWDEPQGVSDPWQEEVDDLVADILSNGAAAAGPMPEHAFEMPDAGEADADTAPASDDTGIHAESSGPAQVPGDYLNLDKLQNYELNVWLKSESHLMGHEIHELAQEPELSDKVHYSLSAALREHTGYTESDKTELLNMERNSVWKRTLITDLTPQERKGMGRAHMLRYAKFTGVGGHRRLAKLKSRLVYDGRSQPIAQSGTNIKSCTPRQSTINMHFGLAPLCENEVNKSADLTSAFLFAPQYTEDGSTSYMRMPADIREYEIVRGRPVEVVYELRKSLYGQRNSPKRFEILFSNWATQEAGLVRSTVDPSLYYSKSGKLRILQFVDDSHARGCPIEFAEFEKIFEEKWGSKFADCNFYLNTITNRDADGYFSMSQPAYAKELVRKHNMEDGRGVNTPLVPGTNIAKEQRARVKEESSKPQGVSTPEHGISNTKTPETKAKVTLKGKQPKARKSAKSERQGQNMGFINTETRDKYASGLTMASDFANTDALVGPNLTKFQEVLGGISYYANTTRPDLSQSVGMMGQVSCAPRMGHWRHLQHILRYIKTYPNQGLRFSKQPDNKKNKLECYVDSSFADGPEGRATTGYAFFMNGGCVSWSSHLQKSSSSSTMEAEVAAACTAAAEAKFLNDLLYEMHSPMRQALVMNHRNKLMFHEDNSACIVFCNNNNVTGRNKKLGRPCNFDTKPLHRWTECEGSPDSCSMKGGRCQNFRDPQHCIDIPSAARHVRQNYREVRTMIEDGEAIMIKCATSEMIADALTKALGPISFRKHMEKLTGYIAPIGSYNPQSEHILDEDRLKEAMKLLPANVNAFKRQLDPRAAKSQGARFRADSKTLRVRGKKNQNARGRSW